MTELFPCLAISPGRAYSDLRNGEKKNAIVFVKISKTIDGIEIGILWPLDPVWNRLHYLTSTRAVPCYLRWIILFATQRSRSNAAHKLFQLSLQHFSNSAAVENDARSR